MYLCSQPSASKRCQAVLRHADPCTKPEVLLQWHSLKIPWAKLAFCPSFPISQQAQLFLKCKLLIWKYLATEGITRRRGRLSLAQRELRGGCLFVQYASKKMSQDNKFCQWLSHAFRHSDGSQHSAAVRDGPGRKGSMYLQQLPLEVAGKAPGSFNRVWSRREVVQPKWESYLLCGLGLKAYVCLRLFFHSINWHCNSNNTHRAEVRRGCKD